MRPPSPLRAALSATLITATIGVAFRVIGGALDPAFRTWAVVAISPVSGLLAYGTARNRDPLPAKVCIWAGAVGLVLWAVVLTAGWMPITSPVDWLWVAVLFAPPAALLAIGLWKRSHFPKP